MSSYFFGNSENYQRITHNVAMEVLHNDELAAQFVRISNKYINSKIGNLALEITLPNMTSTHIKKIMNYIYLIKNNDKQIIEFAKKIINIQTHPNDIVQLIEIFSISKYEHLEFIISFLKTNMLEIKSASTITNIIKHTNTILEKFKCFSSKKNNYNKNLEYDYLVNVYENILTLLNDDVKHTHFINVLEKSSKTECDLIENFNTIKTLYKNPFNSNNLELLLSLIKTFGNFESDNLEIVNLTLYFVGHNYTNTNTIKWCDTYDNIYKRIYNVPNNRVRVGLIPNSRFNVVARALLFTRFMKKDEKYYSRVNQALECPLHQKLVIGNMYDIANSIKNPYSAGINIHSVGREKKTSHAIETLMNKYVLSEEEINNLFNQFWSELELHHDTEQREAILNTLGWNIDRTIKYQNGSSFVGLLVGYGGCVTIFRKKYNAKELIAKFWFFAMTYVPRQSDNQIEEIDNIKQSIFNSLADGFQKHIFDTTNDSNNRFVVCDEGKIQRLVVSVLQSRLEDDKGKLIDIDDFSLLYHNDDEKLVQNVDNTYVSNLEEISQYIKKFVDNISNVRDIPNDVSSVSNTSDTYIGTIDTLLKLPIPKSSNEFFRLLFEYIDNLAKGEILGFPKVRLDPHEVVYYVRMMSPTGVLNNLEINPDKSILATFAEIYEYTDLIIVNDYIEQFNDRDIRIFQAKNNI